MAMTESQNAAIREFWQANQNNPTAIQSAMEQYGVSAQDLAAATGQTLDQVGSSFQQMGLPNGFGGVPQRQSTDYWQQQFNDYSKANNVAMPNLNQQGFEWLKNSADPLATWKQYSGFNMGGAMDGGRAPTTYTATADGAFGPGLSQDRANQLNFWGGQLRNASASMQANGGVPNWNQPTIPAGQLGATAVTNAQAAQNGQSGQSGQAGAPGRAGFGGGLGGGQAGGNLGLGGGNLFAGEYKPNPYLDQQADAIRNKVNQNLSLNIMPSIRSGAMAAGQYGGSRQGIAEGVASGLASQGLSDSLSNLYGNAYNIDQNQITNRTGQNQAFYTNQRGQDLNQYALGANMFTQGLQGNLGLGSAMYGLGQQYMNAPLGALQQYSNTISPYSGLNSTQATTSNSGAGGITGALGGAMGGLQMYKNLGFGGQAVSAPSSLNSTNIYSGSSTPDLSMGYYGSFGG